MSSPAAPTPVSCAQCGTSGTGRFCAECGAPLAEVPCSGCGAALSPTAKFCHRCGLTATAPVRPAAAKGGSMASTLPWAVAGIAFLTLFAMLAGKGFNAKRGSSLDAPANALPNPALDGGGPMGPMAGGMGGSAPDGMRGPDLSSMDPAEISERLFNRIMLLNSQGKSDSVMFFAPMAIQSYQMLRDAQGAPWDLCQRYDVGRIAEVAGGLTVAKAQADTILQQVPDHLLGLLLAANVAKRSGNTPSYNEYAAHFARVKAAQLATKRPEYEKHASDISTGL